MCKVTTTAAAPQAPDLTSQPSDAPPLDYNNPAAEAAVSVVSAAAPEAAAAEGVVPVSAAAPEVAGMQLDSVKLLFDAVPPVMHVGRDSVSYTHLTLPTKA